MKNTYVFIGRSGCGKGTQAGLIVDYLKKIDRQVYYLESGENFRKFIDGSSYSSKLSSDIYKNGKLQPEFLAVWVWSHLMIENLKGDEDLVIDGTPRKLEEAHVLETAFDFYGYEKPTIVHINISRDEAKRRLEDRHRMDDKDPKEVEKRLDWFETDVLPVIEYLRNNGKYKFVEINGENEIEEIHEELIKKLF